MNIKTHVCAYSGAGIPSLVMKALGYKTIAYIEYENQAQQQLAHRIQTGHIDQAPIFSDIQAFNREGFADAYKGMVSLFSGGFPCQPFSQAGKQQGKYDPRDMWPATIESIQRMQPNEIFLENVPRLITWNDGVYFREILTQISREGYAVAWKVLSAKAVGAPHLRERLWIYGRRIPNTYR